jgi:hypothetical protein
MGRFRTTSKNEQPTDYINYYEKKRGLAIYKILRSQTPCYNNAISDNIVLGNQCEKKNIINYKNYDLLINLSKISSILNINRSTTLNVPPVTLDNGLTSDTEQNENLKFLLDKFSQEGFLPEDFVIDFEYEKNLCRFSNQIKIFPYGNFNNYVKNPPIQIHSIRDIQAECDINVPQ